MPTRSPLDDLRDTVAFGESTYAILKDAAYALVQCEGEEAVAQAVRDTLPDYLQPKGEILACVARGESLTEKSLRAAVPDAQQSDLTELVDQEDCLRKEGKGYVLQPVCSAPERRRARLADLRDRPAILLLIGEEGDCAAFVERWVKKVVRVSSVDQLPSDDSAVFIDSPPVDVQTAVLQQWRERPFRVFLGARSAEALREDVRFGRFREDLFYRATAYAPLPVSAYAPALDSDGQHVG